MNRNAVIAFAIAAVPAPALAHGPDGIFDPITMDHHTPVSAINIDIAYAKYDEIPGEDLTVMGIALNGQYVSRRGVGIYGSLPLSYISVETDLPPLDESEFMLGNLELGGLYAKYFSPNTAIVMHAGIALPTATDDNIIAGLQPLASVPRGGDFVQRTLEATWLRLGVSPMGHSGKLLWRADLGIDLALDEDDAVSYSPVFHVSVGGGIDLRTVHLLAELVTSIVDDESDDEVATRLALGVRFVSGNVRPGFAVLLPLGDERGDGLDFALAFSLAARM